MKNKKLYKFLRTGLNSEHGKHEWKVGEWYRVENISICNSGFHASKTPLQALGYVRGEILAEVEVRGEHVIQDDKECWQEMRITKAWHWKKENSVALAIFAAEQVIDIFEKKYPDDKRPRQAIEAAKNYLKDPSEKNRQAAAKATEAAAKAARAAWAAEEVAWAAARAAWAAWAARAAWAAWAAAKAARAVALRKKIDKWFQSEIKKLEVYDN